MDGGVKLASSPSLLLRRAHTWWVQRRPRMTEHASRKDDTRQWLLTRVKRLLRNPWLFRGLMLVWRVYDHFHRD